MTEVARNKYLCYGHRWKEMTDMPEMPDRTENPQTADVLAPGRRTVLRGAAIAAAASLPLLASPATAEAANLPEGKAKGKPVASTKEVLVGGGKALQEEQLIVTQPKKGNVEGFHSICTHANCPVSEMKRGR